MKLRVSYTLLTLVRRGQWEQAVNFYLHRAPITSQAMEEGVMWDKKVTEWVDLYKKLPDEFGGDTLLNPLPQEKIVVPFNEMCDLVIVPDIIDSPILWENKTGIKDSADYSSDFQIPMYFLGLDLAKINVDRAIINHYNQHTDTLDRTLVWKSPQEIERGRNFINTLVPEIFNYFQDNGIFEMALDKEKSLEYNKV